MLTRLKELVEQLSRQTLEEARDTTRRDIVLEAHALVMAMDRGEFVIVVEGNPCDGFTFTGPWADAQDADDYLQNRKGDWWIAKLHSPLPGA